MITSAIEGQRYQQYANAFALARLHDHRWAHHWAMDGWTPDTTAASIEVAVRAAVAVRLDGRLDNYPGIDAPVMAGESMVHETCTRSTSWVLDRDGGWTITRCHAESGLGLAHLRCPTAGPGDYKSVPLEAWGGRLTMQDASRMYDCAAALGRGGGETLALLLLLVER